MGYPGRVDSERDYLVAFSTVPGIGAVRLALLIEYFGSAKSAWEASDGEIEKVGLPKDVLPLLLEQRRKLNVRGYVDSVLKRDIKILTIKDQYYPSRLRGIPSAPFVLFVKSDLAADEFSNLFESKVIGVVGTRKMTSYGREVTEKLVTELVTAGFTIVSGMALGVDGVAAGTAINCGGRTVAVLGAGVEVVYPREHKDLYNSILGHGGAIVSEVAPEKMVVHGIFPARNRIISGLCEAVLVTEGAIDSGSLITARAALEQGREVFAVPGPINSAMAEGTNYLLKQGAKLVTGVGDILEELGYESYGANKTYKANGVEQVPKGDTAEEQKVIDLLFDEPMDFDQLVRGTGIFASKLGSVLALMEVKGRVRADGLVYRLS